MARLRTGVVFNTKELVKNYGSEKVKEAYAVKKTLAGNSKKTLVERAKRYGNIEDLGGGQFIYHKMYDKPISESYAKLMKHPMYSNLSKIIVNKLIENKSEKDSKLVLSLSKLYDVIGVINKTQYDELKYNKAKSIDKYKTSIRNLYIFLDLLDEHLEYCLETTLKLLQEDETICFNKVALVKTGQINNGVTKRSSVKHRRATKSEMKINLDAMKHICMKYDISEGKFTSIFFSNKYEQAKKDYFELLAMHGICFFYQGYEVYYTDIKNAKRFMKNQDNFDFLEGVKNFSNGVKDRLFSSIENRYKKFGDDLMDFEFLYSSIFHKPLDLQIGNKCDVKVSSKWHGNVAIEIGDKE